MAEDWFLYSITLFTFMAIFGLCYINKKLTFFEKNKMPRAANPKFPFGNMYDVVFRETPLFLQLWKFYTRFKKKKCKFGGFYVFLKPAVLVINPEVTDNVLAQKSQFLQEWTDRRCSDFNDELGERILTFIFRKFFTSWPSLTESVATEEVNFSDLMDHYATEVIVSELFCSESRDENFRSILKQALQENSFSNFSKLAEIAYGCSSCNKKQQKICKVVDEAVNSRKKNDIKKDDLLQILLQNDFSTVRIAENMFSLASNLRVSVNLILLLLYELSLNEEIQEDLRGEIKRFKKHKNITEVTDLDELYYLQTVILETLRKYPVEPFICKICKKDYKQNGLSFVEDVLLFISIFGIHHDAQNYINPELFDPDRFSEENEKFVNPKKYLPFGIKNKNNFDSRYITTTMKLIIMQILSNFKISLGKKSPKSLKFNEASFRLQSKDEMWLKVERI